MHVLCSFESLINDESTEHTRSSVSSFLLPHSRLPTPQHPFILLIYSAETAVLPSAAFSAVAMTHAHSCTLVHTHTHNRAHVCVYSVSI